MKLSSLIALAALCFGLDTTRSAIGAEPASNLEPLYIYSFTGNPTIDGRLAEQILVAIGEVPNKPLKEKMDAILNQRNREDRIREAFGCALVADKSAGCRKVVFLTQPPFESVWVPSAELTDSMRNDNANAAWVLHLVEQFHVGGYFLNGTASRFYSDEKGQQLVHRVHTMYWTSYSKQLDAQQRPVDGNDKSAKPRFGSKEAKAAFWYGGSPSRLESEIDKSPAALADLLAVVMALPVGSRTVSPLSEFKALPKLKTLEAAKAASCSGAYCGTRIRQEFADRILVETDWQGRPWLLSVPRWQK